MTFTLISFIWWTIYSLSLSTVSQRHAQYHVFSFKNGKCILFSVWNYIRSSKKIISDEMSYKKVGYASASYELHKILQVDNRRVDIHIHSFSGWILKAVSKFAAQLTLFLKMLGNWSTTFLRNGINFRLSVFWNWIRWLGACVKNVVYHGNAVITRISFLLFESF